MSQIEIKVKNIDADYSIILGNNVLNILPKKIKKLCPKTEKIAIILDKNVPKKYKFILKKLLKKYDLYFFEYKTNEKTKSFINVNKLVEKCLAVNFKRSDIVLGLGGGIIGDFAAFSASLIKRGVNFINIPTSLLAQVDSSIGGKTGVNSKYGKNLIGSFYNPRLVISDISFLKSLPRREMICGYAEILKHSLINDEKFFNWLKINSKNIIYQKKINLIKTAIQRSCKIKLFFVNKDFKEKNIRMMLNFGHTFGHAIEAKSNFSRKINHGEAVLVGMIMATKLSYMSKICSKKTLTDLTSIYKNSGLSNYTNIKKFFKKSEYSAIINFMTNDKKNNDKKINLILLKKIGKTTYPGQYKFSTEDLRKKIKKLSNFNF